VSGSPRIEPPLILASRSPRRRKMLTEAGIAMTVRRAGIDDADLAPGAVTPQQWVIALAYLKARWVAGDAASSAGKRGTVLGADTVCVHEGRILGQPSDADEARSMLRSMRETTHDVVTGVCMIALSTRQRTMFADRASVRWRHVSNEAIERYITSGEWRGKAGGYNLEDRINAGWPIECTGDPTTVMGLPMHRLEPWLAGLRGAHA
jgi:septum formation protein